MFGRQRRRRALERQSRAARGWSARPERDTEPEVRECPVCWGYGSVACRRCNETGDLDRSNDIDRDCRYCQGWGAITCTACGGSGTRPG
jgi:DnaJ-class molecular chaperone